MKSTTLLSSAVSVVALVALLGACSQPAATPAASEAAASAVAPVEAAASVASEAASVAVDAASVAASAATDAASGAASAVAAAAAPATGVVPLDIVDAAGVKLTGDVAAGAKVFRQCATCHVVTEGVNKVGPSLYKIIGRTAGQVPGFRYSEANKKSGVVWTEQKMFEYLENPKKVIPGTIMAFAGLKQAKQRADVIAYLQVNAK